MRIESSIITSLSELRAIEFVDRLIDENRLPEGRYRKMLVHNLSEGQPLAPLGVGVDLNTDLAFFEQLFATGRAAAERWIEANYDALGARSTVDLAAMFRGVPAPDDSKPLR